MQTFVIPVMLRVSSDENPTDKSIFFNMYAEKEIEAETYEEAYEKAHIPEPEAGGPKRFPELLNIIEVNKWNPDELPDKEVVME